MARLVLLSLATGTRLELRGEIFKVVDTRPGQQTVLLARVAAGNQIEIARNELAELLVNEEARLLDELEEPDPGYMRSCTDISALSIDRMFEWQFKLFLCRTLMPLNGISPKSLSYRETFKNAASFLHELHSDTRLTPQWSTWTIYHDLLRWRAKKHDVAAFQRKGVEYTPWRDSSKARSIEAKRIFDEIQNENPNLSASSIHRKMSRRSTSNPQKEA